MQPRDVGGRLPAAGGDFRLLFPAFAVNVQFLGEISLKPWLDPGLALVVGDVAVVPWYIDAQVSGGPKIHRREQKCLE